ncbi:hypothetical protein Mapa_014057 [Marchantia paleacea]|nr:hypothetical protein Mapa_014057 [Marchantia paleacea]
MSDYKPKEHKISLTRSTVIPILAGSAATGNAKRSQNVLRTSIRYVGMREQNTETVGVVRALKLSECYRKRYGWKLTSSLDKG